MYLGILSLKVVKLPALLCDGARGKLPLSNGDEGPKLFGVGKVPRGLDVSRRNGFQFR